ncbi:hypothetical protein L195_g040839 [Trifolium pratense]|uniref:Uncharacterized protein n=1 Tax=Trifolium pratense TaxID=57577 RepID=A0A2K3M1V2_TRIPR|nr:hypothetical protein L195_g052935 [Trifolium pratense]PNX84776.1 hypothetical protein L195_g040839 [Trifolium pratense]
MMRKKVDYDAQMAVTLLPLAHDAQETEHDVQKLVVDLYKSCSCTRKKVTNFGTKIEDWSSIDVDSSKEQRVETLQNLLS